MIRCIIGECERRMIPRGHRLVHLLGYSGSKRLLLYSTMRILQLTCQLVYFLSGDLLVSMIIPLDFHNGTAYVLNSGIKIKTRCVKDTQLFLTQMPG